MKSAHLILHVRKSGVYSAAAGGPEVLCRIIPGIHGAPRTGARDGAAPVGTAPSGPGAGATWWRFLHCSEIGKTGLCGALP